MPSANVPTAPAHIPAWKRLGLKLKSAQDSSALAGELSIEPNTSKRKRPDTTADDTPAKKSRRSANLLRQSESQVPVTPQLTRKKSVTFTPETKAEDGDSIKQLFNSWVAEQKSTDLSFQFSNSAPVFKTPEAPRVEEEVDPNLDEKERRVKRVKQPKPEKPQKSKQPKKPAKVTKPPVPSSRPFLAYLKEYCESRNTWKFNKNHQNHLLRNAFDLEVIPSDHTHHLFEYVRGLQGGVRTRLRDTALAIKVKDQEDGTAVIESTMAERQQRDYDLAMKEHVAEMTALNAPSSMGYEEGVLLGLSDRAMAKRVAKRLRAERVLEELASSPDGTGASAANGDDDESSQKRLRYSDDTPQLKAPRKRKQRTAAEDDSSSSSDDSSDSDEDSSDDSAEQEDQGEDGDDDTSSSSSSSSSESNSEEGNSDDSSEESSEESDSE
ncbi:related to SRP40 Suppressor of mutant AC40 of RNA polymerase I and III [Phialocephala subalpina]|uniref:Related to SRP40 Suppressor of mutant AC40 of RNA polymerase I and III n=1 Tax=Phialocephala subalpina TaxID=576137 RepID=A0A1L7X613_9HELO|nr:related to SRP40 Suppressor of mutant AC40 of RNA polymerase I and III [Phialocephala subalpina]